MKKKLFGLCFVFFINYIESSDFFSVPFSEFDAALRAHDLAAYKKQTEVLVQCLHNSKNPSFWWPQRPHWRTHAMPRPKKK